MSRRAVIAIVVFVLWLLVGAGLAGYIWYGDNTRGTPPPDSPKVEDTGDTLPTQAEFDALAESDPVKMLAACLIRYGREVHAAHCTCEKQERVQGHPKPPEAPPVEVMDVWVRGEVPDTETKQTAVEIAVKWKSGAKSFLRAEIVGTLYSERPEPAGLGGKLVTWRPKAFISALSTPFPPNNDLAQGQSRYSIRDGGFYRIMLRTHEAWKARQDTGEFKYEYLGIQKPPKTGGRECHVIKRICPRVEVDAFELGGTAPTDPKTVAAEGFTEVVIYIDRERWFQTATEVYRTEPDGTRVTVATYHFRDAEFNPTIPPDTFTVAGLKK